jgi:hypothetical protein
MALDNCTKPLGTIYRRISAYITRLVSECCSLKFLNRCEDSDNIAGRQHLLVYSKQAKKYTRIVQVPHGTIHFSRQNEQKVSIGQMNSFSHNITVKTAC